MRTVKVIIIGVITAVFALCLATSNGRSEGRDSKAGPELNLKKQFQRLLAGEMNAIQNGMTNLVMAIPAGHWNDIMDTARKMNETYIINKKLSKEQKDEFEGSLPEGYRQMDSYFHEAAGQMIHAAEQRDLEEVSMYFHRLVKSCLQCHSHYARERFPDFGVPVQ